MKTLWGHQDKVPKDPAVGVEAAHGRQLCAALVRDAPHADLEEHTEPSLVLGMADIAIPAPIHRQRALAQSVPTRGEDGCAARTVHAACHEHVIW